MPLPVSRDQDTRDSISRLTSLLRRTQAETSRLKPFLQQRRAQGSGAMLYFNALNRSRCGLAPSSPRRRFLSSSYSR